MRSPNSKIFKVDCHINMLTIQYSRQQVATFLAILFHLCGCIGILFTPYKDWFVSHTPLNLLLMVVLLIWVQQQKNIFFWGFLLTTFLTGMLTEMIGVNKGWLFGNYGYGSLLGPKWNGVPLLIGVNWFMIVFCSGSMVYQMQDWLKRKFDPTGVSLSRKISLLSLIADGAIMATFFDWIMEPVAIKLGFWYWMDSEIPFYNYLCWFVISALLLALFRSWSFKRHNFFAVHLLIIQLLFFLTLRTFL